MSIEQQIAALEAQLDAMVSQYNDAVDNQSSLDPIPIFFDYDQANWLRTRIADLQAALDAPATTLPPFVVSSNEGGPAEEVPFPDDSAFPGYDNGGGDQGGGGGSSAAAGNEIVQLPPVTANDPWEHDQRLEDWRPLSDWQGSAADFDVGTMGEIWRWLVRLRTDLWRNRETGEVRDNIGGYEYDVEKMRVAGTRPAAASAGSGAPAGDEIVQLPPVTANDPWEHDQRLEDWQPLSDWQGSAADFDVGTTGEIWRWLVRLRTDLWRNRETGEVRDNIGGYEYDVEKMRVEGTRPAATSAGSGAPAGDEIITLPPFVVKETPLTTTPASTITLVTVPFTATNVTTTTTDDKIVSLPPFIVNETPLTTTTDDKIVSLPPFIVNETPLQRVTANDPWEHDQRLEDWRPLSDWQGSAADFDVGTTGEIWRWLVRLRTDLWRNRETGEVRDNIGGYEYDVEKSRVAGTRPAAGGPIYLPPPAIPIVTLPPDTVTPIVPIVPVIPATTVQPSGGNSGWIWLLLAAAAVAAAREKN